MRSRIFAEATFGGKFFTALVHDSVGPMLVDSTGLHSAPIGAISIARMADWKPVRQEPPRYWVVKYTSECKLDLGELSASDRQAFASYFGIPVRDMQGNGGMDYGVLFYKSPAFQLLVEWAKKRPRLLARFAHMEDYLPGWADHVKIVLERKTQMIEA